MEHQTLEQIAEVARLTPLDRRGARALRRQRLERLATLLDQHKGSMRLFSLIEYATEEERQMLRDDESPLAIAFRDPEFRRQGLNSDRLGDATTFFDLSQEEAHRLFCECGYFYPITPEKVARRARSFARKMTFAEIWDKVRSMILGKA